ncbi:MAG: DUF349 domain-containing protein [Burkholderiales bacterium]|nr:DUF349 domain-containing protein [Burkholderiales bacterium]
MLKSLFSGTPKWQSPNADERLTAVAELAAEDPALNNLLASDADARVRAAAAARTASIDALRTALADADASVRTAVAARWANLAAPGDNLPLAVVAAAARDDASDEWKAVAARVAQGDLTAWLGSNANVASKLDAIGASQDVVQLEKLHLHWRDHDKRLGKACHDRVAALQAQDKAAQEADVLLAQMQSWVEAEEVPLSRLVDTQRAWAKLAVDGERKTRFDGMLASLQQRMQNEAVARRMHEALAMQVAGLSLKSKKAAELSHDELTALATEATLAQSSPVLDAGLAQQLQAVHAAIATEQQLRERNAAGEALLAALPVAPVAPATLKRPRKEPTKEATKATPQSSTAAAADAGSTSDAAKQPDTEPATNDLPAAPTPEANVAPTPPDAAAEPTTTPAMDGSQVETVVPDLPVASTNTEPTAASAATDDAAHEAFSRAQSDYRAAHDEWKTRWAAWLGTVDATTREHFEKRLHALEKPAHVKPERQAVARADDADLAAANEALNKLAELVAAGDVRGSRQAATRLFQQFTAKRYPKLEEQRLNELDGEVKRLESWLKWSDGQARDGLIARAEALKANPLPVDALAKEVRAIQDEWKALDKKNGGAPKPKWDKFNALCKEAYAPAKAHFDTLRKQRNENASGREKIIEAMSALGDEAAAPLAEGQTRDWLDLERRKSALFDQWKKGGGVANAAWKALDEKFETALKKLDGAMDGVREPEIARRKRLIAQAEELAKATPSRETTDATIALQRRWNGERPIGLPHLRRKDEQRLWDEFKKHTDAVFKARDAQRDQVKAQFSEATKARFAVIDEAKALAGGDDAKAIDSGIAAVRTKWRNLPFVEREKARDFERKFDDAVAAARKRATVLSRGSVIEAMKNTLAGITATDTADKTAAALVIDAELIAGIDSPTEIAAARRMQQLRWLSERRQLPTAPDAKITAIRTLLGAFNATGAKITLGERERLTRAIESVGAA